MVINQRINLHGNKEERIMQALDIAGYHDDRKVNLSIIEKYYKDRNINFFKSAKDFFLKFSGIARNWYIEVTDFKHGADFTFELFPYPEAYKTDVRDYMFEDAKYEVYSEDYRAVLDLAKEKVVLVGEIGFYYPGLVWIGESGNLYATHEYDYKVYTFKSIIELISRELVAHDMTSLAVTL
ncbi:MAG: SUKH-3 domain-containing protein [Cellulosilyticaceae bacterium]